MIKRLLCFLCITFLFGCHTISPSQRPITEDNLSSVSTILEKAQCSNVDTFERWVKDFHSKQSASQTSHFSDADCRLTVLLLVCDLINYSSLNTNYTGDYLIFDLDALENNKEFEILKEKKDLLITLFGEMKIPKSGILDALPNNWKQHNIHLSNKNISIINIVFKTYDKEEVFVGHTGVLIETNNQYVFIEKLSFEDDFMMIYIKDEKELLDLLSKRKDYTVDKDEPSPMVYKNDTWIGNL